MMLYNASYEHVQMLWTLANEREKEVLSIFWELADELELRAPFVAAIIRYTFPSTNCMNREPTGDRPGISFGLANDDADRVVWVKDLEKLQFMPVILVDRGADKETLRSKVEEWARLLIDEGIVEHRLLAA